MSDETITADYNGDDADSFSSARNELNRAASGEAVISGLPLPTSPAVQPATEPPEPGGAATQQTSLQKNYASQIKDLKGQSRVAALVDAVLHPQSYRVINHLIHLDNTKTGVAIAIVSIWLLFSIGVFPVLLSGIHTIKTFISATTCSVCATDLSGTLTWLNHWWVLLAWVILSIMVTTIGGWFGKSKGLDWSNFMPKSSAS